MKVRGIKRGQIIELVEAIDIPDGTEVSVEIDDRQLLTLEERQAKFQAWLDQPSEEREDLIAALEEVERERRFSAELARLNLGLLESSSSEPLASIIGTAQGSFATPEEADQFIRQERDAWDS
jgi:antitoxin component of MazEF toxin-antitoxin module